MDAVEHTRMLIPLTIAPSQRRALSDAQTRERALAGGSSSCIATCEVPLLHFEVPHCTCGFLYCYRLMLRSLELMAVEATLTGAGCETAWDLGGSRILRNSTARNGGYETAVAVSLYSGYGALHRGFFVITLTP